MSNIFSNDAAKRIVAATAGYERQFRNAKPKRRNFNSNGGGNEIIFVVAPEDGIPGRTESNTNIGATECHVIEWKKKSENVIQPFKLERTIKVYNPWTFLIGDIGAGIVSCIEVQGYWFVDNWDCSDTSANNSVQEI